MMRNPFTKQTRELFFYNYDCFECSFSGWDALHHIMGRESSSPLNASPIHNMKCHIGNATLETFDSRSRLLKKTYTFLMTEDYELTEKDREFMKRHELLYNN